MKTGHPKSTTGDNGEKQPETEDDNNNKTHEEIEPCIPSSSSNSCTVNVLPLENSTNTNSHHLCQTCTTSSSIDADLDSMSCYDTISLSEPCCRVCQCNASEEKLISPCFCSGSVKWIHASCLIQWMKSSLAESCELCTKKIKIMKRRKPFSKWKLPSQRPTPVLWVLFFLTAIAINLASIEKDASRLCSSTSCLVFYAVRCICVILGTLFLIYWSKRARMFLKDWLELNEEWVIVVDSDGEIHNKVVVANGDLWSVAAMEENGNESPSKNGAKTSWPPHCTVPMYA